MEKLASSIKEIIRIIAGLEFVFRIPERLKKLFNEIRDRNRSQTLSSMWSVQRGELLRLRL